MEVVFIHGGRKMGIYLKRIYDESSEDDGVRILVDRLWPRGISKEKANLDEWLKEIAPSTELRKEFNHDPNKFPDFKQKYKEELKLEKQREQLKELMEIVKDYSNVTLLYAAKDEKYNQAVVLKEVLEGMDEEKEM